jgi:hypothetical protein
MQLETNSNLSWRYFLLIGQVWYWSCVAVCWWRQAYCCSCLNSINTWPPQWKLFELRVKISVYKTGQTSSKTCSWPLANGGLRISHVLRCQLWDPHWYKSGVLLHVTLKWHTSSFIYAGGNGLGSTPRPNGFRLNCENYHTPEQFITTRVKYSCSSVSALGNVDGILS